MTRQNPVDQILAEELDPEDLNPTPRASRFGRRDSGDDEGQEVRR